MTLYLTSRFHCAVIGIMMNHRLKFNRSLVWDYDICEKDLEKEEVFIFYLSRILNNGCYSDVIDVPIEVIEKYLPKLHLSTKVRNFWEWYFGNNIQNFADPKEK